MATKLDEQAIERQLEEIRKAHPDLSAADFDAIRKGMEDHAKDWNSRPDQKESLGRDAALIGRTISTAGVEMAGSAVDFILNAPMWAANWALEKTGSDLRAPTSDLAGKMTRGWNDVLTAAGAPEAVTERERRMVEGFDTPTKAGIMLSSVPGLARGGLTAAFGNAGTRVVPKTFGAAGADVEAAALARTGVRGADETIGSAAPSAKTPTPTPQPAAMPPKTGVAVEEASAGADDAVREAERIVRQHEAEMKAARAAEEAAPATGQPGSLWEKFKYDNSFITYMRPETKATDLAEKLETLSQQLANPLERENMQNWLKLLVDRRRISGVSTEELAAIKAQPHIPREIISDFEDIASRNSWKGMTGWAYRAGESWKGRLDFVQNHPYITSAEAGSIYFKPLGYAYKVLRDPSNIPHHLKGLGVGVAVMGADHFLTDNHITGGWARSYAWGAGKAADLGTAAYGIAAPAVENLTDHVFSSGDDAEMEPGPGGAASRIGNSLAAAGDRLEKEAGLGVTNTILSGADQMGYQLDPSAVRNNVSWGIEKFGPSKLFGAITAIHAFNEAQKGDPAAPFMSRFASSFSKIKMDEYETDLSNAATLAGSPEAGQKVARQTGNLVAQAEKTVRQAAVSTPASEAEEKPGLLESITARATQTADAAGQILKDGAPAATAGAMIAAVASEAGNTMDKAARELAELKQEAEERQQQLLAKLAEQEKSLKDAADKRISTLQKEWDDNAKKLKEETAQQVASLQKDLADMKDAAAKKVIDIKDNAGKIAMASMFPDLTEAFGKAKDWFKEPGNLLTAGLAFGAALLVGNMMFGGSNSGNENPAPAPAASGGGGMGMMGNILGLALLAAAAVLLYKAVTNDDKEAPQVAQENERRAQPGLNAPAPG